MADTIGDFIDKLSIANVRLWHLEDYRRELAARMDNDDEVASMTNDEVYAQSIKAKELMQSIAKVNRERNDLIDQINAGLQVLLDKAQGKDTSIKITATDLLGTAKNKFYKTEDYTTNPAPTPPMSIPSMIPTPPTGG